MCVHSGAQCFWNRIDLGLHPVSDLDQLCDLGLIVITVFTILASPSPRQHLGDQVREHRCRCLVNGDGAL